jgi:hypothetical protein
MVLAASYEFNKQSNSEIVERPSDEIELREVLVVVILAFSLNKWKVCLLLLLLVAHHY